MKLHILIIALITISGIVIAVPDSVITDPFKVSFDLGLNHSDYNITVSKPIIDETLGGDKRTEYDVTLDNKTGGWHSAYISIITTDKSTDYGPAVGAILEKSLKDSFASFNSVPNLQSATRIIDKKSGAVASATVRSSYGFTVDVFHAGYPLDSFTDVNIASTYPWSEGTLQLLKTIHIERTSI